MFPSLGKLVPWLWEARSLALGTAFPACGNNIPRLMEKLGKPSRWDTMH